MLRLSWFLGECQQSRSHSPDQKKSRTTLKQQGVPHYQVPPCLIESVTCELDIRSYTGNHTQYNKRFTESKNLFLKTLSKFIQDIFHSWGSRRGAGFICDFLGFAGSNWHGYTTFRPISPFVIPNNRLIKNLTNPFGKTNSMCISRK